jgi:ring-1,2-phenylacetyl-CoA epoxidase subunit PaaC
MANEKNLSLIFLAETIADNKLIIGDRLVEIGISGPKLEATLSSIAMAQAELGHARLIYRWAHELNGLNGSKMEIKSQTGKAFERVVDISNWVSLIAGVYVVNIAIDLVMQAIVNKDNQEINAPFSKMLKEQHEHIIYSKNWCEQLLNDKGSVPKVFIQELEKVSVEAEQWLRKVESDNLLISNQILSENSNLVDLLKGKINELTKNGVVSNV